MSDFEKDSLATTEVDCGAGGHSEPAKSSAPASVVQPATDHQPPATPVSAALEVERSMLDVGCSPPSSAVCPPPSPIVSSPSSSCPPLTPLPGESTRAFEAYCAYLELGPGRRFSAVARKFGVSLRTVQRWALEFDWRERLSTRAAHRAEQSAQIQARVQTEELLDATARAKAFRERQFLLAEAVLDVTERYLERLDDVDLEQVRFPDACRALEFAARLARQARETEATVTPDHGLRDQLVALLDQACRETGQPA